MVIIYVLLLLLISVGAMLVYKDIMSPAVLQSLPWAISIAFLPLTDFSYSTNVGSYMYIILGSFLFQIGFIIAVKKIKSNMRFKQITDNYRPKLTTIKLFILIEIIFLMFLYFTLYNFIYSNFIISEFTTLKIGFSNNLIPFQGIFIYIRNLITVITICMYILYFYIDNSLRKKYKKFLIIQFIIEILNLIPATSRNSVLLVVLSILSIFILNNNLNNKITIKYFIRFIIVFTIFFIVFSYFKYSNLFMEQSNLQVIINQFAIYLSSSVVAFEKYFVNPSINLYGKNTFRIFIAIFDRLNGSNSAVSIVQNFVSVGNNVNTNVYTFYHYYASDFGLIYALFVQLFIGVLHGITYKNLQLKSPLNIFTFSIFIYPLVMQFFQDQYISILSNWIQMFVVAVIFFKTNIFLFKKIKL